MLQGSLAAIQPDRRDPAGQQGPQFSDSESTPSHLHPRNALTGLAHLSQLLAGDFRFPASPQPTL